MPKDNIIQFPKTSIVHSRETKVHILEERVNELEVENEFVRKDIDYLQGALETNIRELQDCLKELSVMHGQNLEDIVIEFKSEFGDFDIDFEPDNNEDK